MKDIPPLPLKGVPLVPIATVAPGQQKAAGAFYLRQSGTLLFHARAGDDVSLTLDYAQVGKYSGPTAIIFGLLPGLAVSESHTKAAEPVRLIFDTDIGNDVDDALALGVIHALQSRAECQLLAVTITKDIPSAKKLASEWPTPILYSGFEIGLAIT